MSSKRARFIERVQKRREEATARQELRNARSPHEQIKATIARGQTVGKRELRRLAPGSLGVA